MLNVSVLLPVEYESTTNVSLILYKICNNTIISLSSSYSYFLNANFVPTILSATHPRKIRKRTVNHSGPR
ncbi:hypothetical protein PUN28_011970 [Cardiocondyla obscurior]|uniref:Uncharacterized protein n=1 Tax=Cardiocondyla obscurior TaxID=286306 RepID=A0AAW2F8G5_9HYME